MNTMNFTELKERLTELVNEYDARDSAMNDLDLSETIPDLLKVVIGNFSWVSARSSIAALLSDIDVMVLAESRIYLSGNHRVSGTEIAYASGSATVRASDSAVVLASDSAVVEAWGSAVVEASGSATVRAWGSAVVRASGSAVVEASGIATVQAWGSAVVEASGSAIASVFAADKLIVTERAIGRVRSENKVVFSADHITASPL